MEILVMGDDGVQIGLRIEWANSWVFSVRLDFTRLKARYLNIQALARLKLELQNSSLRKEVFDLIITRTWLGGTLYNF